MFIKHVCTSFLIWLADSATVALNMIFVDHIKIGSWWDAVNLDFVWVGVYLWRKCLKHHSPSYFCPLITSQAKTKGFELTISIFHCNCKFVIVSKLVFESWSQSIRQNTHNVTFSEPRELVVLYVCVWNTGLVSLLKVVLTNPIRAFNLVEPCGGTSTMVWCILLCPRRSWQLLSRLVPTMHGKKILNDCSTFKANLDIRNEMTLSLKISKILIILRQVVSW